jgi:tetraacyldisaccharide-1-P 4'-kinase
MTEKDAVRMDKKLIQKNMWFLKMKVKLNVNITKLITDKLNERKL